METFQSSSGRESWLSWALALSLLLHGLLLWLLPNPKIEPPPKPPTLVVDLVQPKPVAPQVPAPTPAPKQEEVKPEPPKPQHKPEPKPVKKETPAVVKNEPAAVPPLHQQEPSPPVISAPPPPTPAPAPVEVAPPPPPPPEPPKPVGPTSQELDDARGAYGSLLTREIAKHKQYPRIAQMRGWQGDVVLELQLDGNGALISSKILTSSNYEALDKQALEMVKKASPFPSPPGVLRGRNFTVQVPVNFRLE